MQISATEIKVDIERLQDYNTVLTWKEGEVFS
jgi:hypothetical protein